MIVGTTRRATLTTKMCLTWIDQWMGYGLSFQISCHLRYLASKNRTVACRPTDADPSIIQKEKFNWYVNHSEGVNENV